MNHIINRIKYAPEQEPWLRPRKAYNLDVAVARRAVAARCEFLVIGLAGDNAHEVKDV